MNIWIINPYGNIPGEGWRDYRSTMIANALERAGHQTIWWVSNFVHRSKSYRSYSWKDIQVSHGFLVRIVPSTAYSSHTSYERVIYERNYGRNLYEKALQCNPPHVIILAEPSLFFSKPVLELKRRWKVKLIVDIIDLWPELFNILLPHKLAWVSSFIFSSFYKRRATLFKKADAVVAVAQDYLDVAVEADRKKIMEVVYWGVDLQSVRIAMNTPQALPDVIDVNSKRSDEVWITYAGTLGYNYDIKTIMAVAKRVEWSQLPVKLIIAGDGSLRTYVEDTITMEALKKTIYVGSLHADVLTYLYSFCDAVLLAYVFNSTVSMPIKAFDSFAAGLPIINSLGRTIGRLVEKYNVGLQYEAGNEYSLFDAIAQISLDKETRISMGNNARLLADQFDLSVMYRKYATIVEEVAKSDANQY